MQFRPSTINCTSRASPSEGFPKGRLPTGRSWELLLRSPNQTDRLGRAIGQSLRGGETLASFGPLGAGKTTLVRGIAVGLDAPAISVSSPTFVFIHEYRGRLLLAHVDLYRLNSTQELQSIGLDEHLCGTTVVVVEWADKGLSILPGERLEIELQHRTVRSRRVRISATGPASSALLTQIKQRYAPSLRRAPSHRLTASKFRKKASS